MPLMLDISPATNGKSAMLNSERLNLANVSATVCTWSKGTVGRSILTDDKFSNNRIWEKLNDTHNCRADYMYVRWQDVIRQR